VTRAPMSIRSGHVGGGESWRLAIVAIVPICTFLIDIASEYAFIGGILPYFLAVFGCLWTGGRRGLIFVATLSVGFLLAGTFLKHPMPDLFYLNRATLVVGLIIAALVTDRAISFKFRAGSGASPRSAREGDGGPGPAAISNSHALAGIEAANVGLWEWKLADGSLILTPKLEAMLGCVAGERITTFEDWKSRVDLVGGAIQEQFSADFAAGKHDGRYTAEYHIDLPNGVRRYLITRAGPLLDEQGNAVGLTGADTDITEIRELTEELRLARDAAEAANRAKTAFLANMSHELRTPLNSIIGFSQVMEAQLLGPIGSDKYTDYATDVREAGEHLLDVINDILDISRIESGEIEVDQQIVSVADTIDTITRFCQPAADRAGVTFVKSMSGQGLTLRVDPRHFLQIGVNLVSNAVKFSSDGGIVEVSAAPESDNRVTICVSDTGAGIPNAHLDRVFEPFQQLSSRRSRAHQGTGLGLSIARSLAELHGGTLRLESRLGEGTKAILTLPLPSEDMA
jgi:signal transduction histidine kinase